MRDRLLLVLYLAALVAATLVHDPRALGAALVVLLLFAGRKAPILLRRALWVILPLNLVVSLGYGLLSDLRGFSPWDTLLLLNLRVLTLTLLSFLFIDRVNLFRALAFSPGLCWLLTLSLSQALGFQRAHADFRLALISRSSVRPRLIDRYRASAAAAAWFMDQALASARERALALRARGFFDD